MSLQQKYREAAENVKKLKESPNEDELLEIYSLYKQAEIGDCNTQFPSTSPKDFEFGFTAAPEARPGFLDFKGKAKWEAWNGKKGLPQEDAMKEYISRVENLIRKYGVV